MCNSAAYTIIAEMVLLVLFAIVVDKSQIFGYIILVIRSQKLVGPVIGGVPAGTPLFIFEVLVCRNHF